MSDRDRYGDLRRTEGPSSPAGRLPFGEAKPLRLRRIDPEGALWAPGDAPAHGSGAGGFVLATEPARAGTGRLQALIAVLLSFLFLGSLTALALIGSGGLPGGPLLPPQFQLEQEVVRGPPVEALPVSPGGPAGAPGQAGQGSEEAPTTTPPVVDETEPPGVIPAGGGQDGQGDEDQDGTGDQNGSGDEGDDVDQGGPPGGEGPTGDGPDGPAVSAGSDEVTGNGKGPKATGKGHQKAKGTGHQKAKGKGHIHDGDGSGDHAAEPGKDKGKDKGADGHPAGGPPGSSGGPPADGPGHGKGTGKGPGG